MNVSALWSKPNQVDGQILAAVPNWSFHGRDLMAPYPTFSSLSCIHPTMVHKLTPASNRKVCYRTDLCHLLFAFPNSVISGHSQHNGCALIIYARAKRSSAWMHDIGEYQCSDWSTLRFLYYSGCMKCTVAFCISTIYPVCSIANFYRLAYEQQNGSEE